MMAVPNSRLNPLLFASKQAHQQQQQPQPPPPPSSRPSPQYPSSRNLPAFGNPNHFPNPPTHYFPSIPAATRRANHQAKASSSDDEDQPPARSEEQRGWNSGHDLMDEDERDECVEQQEQAGGKVVTKKRSRTLTTAYQTAVLNALLAKTRFPSTERREEVGQQIGMSARRVQIWFQNRRQSQKRARDREADLPPLSPTNDYPPDTYYSSRYPLSSSLSHQNSRESFASSHSTLGPGGREHLPTLNEHPQWTPHGWPGALPTPPSVAGGMYGGNYFPSLEPSSSFSAPPLKRPSMSRQSSTSSMTATDISLPPLGTLFPSSGPSSFASHSPPRRPSATGSFTSDRSSRSILSPDDSFARLRISPTRETHSRSQEDDLDEAMSLMQRRAHAPLPPLRYGRRASEADAALLAPIKTASSTSSGGTARFPPLASLALSFPLPGGYPLPSPTFSNGPSPTTASFPAMQEWRGARTESTSGSSYRPGGRNSIGSFANSGASSCRTSLSSEVEWERGAQGEGYVEVREYGAERGERKLAQSGREGEKGRGIKGYEVTPWEFEGGSDQEMGRS